MTRDPSASELDELLEGIAPKRSTIPDLGVPRLIGAEYNFPITVDIPASDTDDKLLRVLTEAVDKFRKRRPTFEKEDRFRRLYCTICLEMNRRGKLAPAFRPRLPPPPMMRRLPTDNTHALDLQVIDLHWWFLNGGTERASKTLAPLFHFGEFPVHVAENFATLKWKPEQKVSAMKLAPDQKWLMAAIRDAKLAQQRRGFEKKAKSVFDLMTGLAQNDGRLLGTAEDWSRLHMAQSIAAHVTLTTGQTSSRLVAKLYNLMTGKDIARQSVATKIKRLGQWMSNSRGISKTVAKTHS